MATRTAVVATLPGGGITVTWSGMLNGDNGNGVSIPFTDHLCAQLSGVFGVGGSVSIKGTNLAAIDTTNDPILKDLQDGAWTKTAAGMENIQERPGLIYPHCTAGDVDTALVVAIVISRRGGIDSTPPISR